jgi:hypothetical protein
MSFEFPFEYADISGLGRLFYPIVRLKLKTIYGWQSFEFLVDTGADTTTVPTSIFPILGLDKSKLHNNISMGVGGYNLKSWDFNLLLQLGNIEIKVKASAVETKANSMPLLLGRKDIFEDRFNLQLDSKKKTTIITTNY